MLVKKKLLFIIIISVVFCSGYFYLSKNSDIADEEIAIELENGDSVNVEQTQNGFIVDVGEVEMANNKNDEDDSKKDEGARAKTKENFDGDNKILLKNFLLKVPFASQAPLGVWDEYHEEACEEASLIMLKYYLDGKSEISKKQMEIEIQKMINFQIKNYGKYKDSNMEELVRLAYEFYGLNNLKVMRNFTKNDLKKWLAQEKPIIAPTAGRLLDNPHFTPPGPLYHNLVLIGYDENKIITNDPGTKRGANYEYDIDILYEAIHDFPGKKEDIEKGKKAIIIVEKN